MRVKLIGMNLRSCAQSSTKLWRWYVQFFITVQKQSKSNKKYALCIDVDLALSNKFDCLMKCSQLNVFWSACTYTLTLAHLYAWTWTLIQDMIKTEVITVLRYHTFMCEIFCICWTSWKWARISYYYILLLFISTDFGFHLTNTHFFIRCIFVHFICFGACFIYFHLITYCLLVDVVVFCCWWCFFLSSWAAYSCWCYFGLGKKDIMWCAHCTPSEHNRVQVYVGLRIKRETKWNDSNIKSIDLN